MKNVILYYIISTLVYFAVGTGHRYWAVFNMGSVMFTIVYFCWWVAYNEVKVTSNLRGWFIFMLILSGGRGLYTLVCSYAPVSWIYSMNKIFSIIFALCLIVKLIINQRLNRKPNGMKYH